MKKLLFCLTCMFGLMISAQAYDFTEEFKKIGGDTIEISSIPFDNFLDSAYCTDYELDADMCYERLYYFFLTDPNGKNFNKIFSTNIMFSLSSLSVNSIDITLQYFNNDNPSENDSETKTYNITYKGTYDEGIVTKANTISQKYGKNFYLLDMAYINQLMNYGYNYMEEISNDNSVILNMFPEIKENLEKGSDFSFQPVMDGLGGCPGLNGAVGPLLIKKDGIAYSLTKSIMYGTLGVFLVPDDTEDVDATLLKRIKDYVNDDTINISISKATEAENLNECGEAECGFWVNPNVKEALNLPDSQFETLYYKFTFKDINAFVYVSKVPASYIKELEIKSLNLATGIEMSTTANNVPLDTKLRVTNVTSDLNDENIISAFDIDLYSLIKDGYITQIAGGVKVMIPIAADVNEVIIHHVKDDKTLGEKYEVKYETIGTQKYAVIVTNHFSTYALYKTDPTIKKEEPKNEEVKNPETSDNIMLYIVCGSIALVGIIGTVIYFKKKK